MVKTKHKCKNYEYYNGDECKQPSDICENFSMKDNVSYQQGGGEPDKIEVKKGKFEELTKENCHLACLNYSGKKKDCVRYFKQFYSFSGLKLKKIKDKSNSKFVIELYEYPDVKLNKSVGVKIYPLKHDNITGTALSSEVILDLTKEINNIQNNNYFINDKVVDLINTYLGELLFDCNCKCCVENRQHLQILKKIYTKKFWR